jgi:hypothetical protein
MLSAGLFAQQPKRVMLKESSQTDYNPAVVQSRVSMRIENGKVWVNEKQVPAQELPRSLRDIHPSLYYETAGQGITEIAFNLGASEYLLRDGKIVEVERRTTSKSAEPAGGYADIEAKKSYYSQLKKDSPGLFYSLGREAALVEQVKSLLLEYDMAPRERKDKVSAEIKLLLDQLFDINEHNQVMEIEQLEQMLDAAKTEVKYRQKNKSIIVDQMATDLLKNR